MRILLKPPPDSGLADIEITRQLFTVGRRAAPFASYSRSAVARLSKRHARLFVEAGALYAVDLGSLNGSTLNGQTLGTTPAAVTAGDVLTFGGLAYEVAAFDPPSAGGEPARALRLVLKPAAEDSLLEPAVVAELPFLIRKSSELFHRIGEVDPELLSYLSRHHAQILRLENEFLVEDLGSTNGTFLNGRNIEEHLTSLADGDRLSFGAEELCYDVFVVDVTRTDEPQPTTEEAETQLVTSVTGSTDASAVFDSSRTIFVDSATSFIDAYFQAPSPDEDAAEDEAGAVAEPEPRKTVGSAVASTLFGSERTRKRLALGAGAVAVLFALGFAGYYWRGADQRALERLLAEARYEEALARANALLDARPDDDALQETATRAMLEAFLPDWLASYESGDSALAAVIVEDARKASSSNPTDDGLLDLLSWTSESRAYLESRTATLAGGADPFADALRIGQLLRFWTADQNQRARELRRLNEVTPAFDVVHKQVFEDVRRLRELELDAEPLRALREALAMLLEKGDVAAVRAQVAESLEPLRAPRVAALLAEEVNAFEALQSAMVETRWLDAHALATGERFRTGPFIEHAQALGEAALPDEAFLDGYQSALHRWQDGEFEASAALLETLLGTPWASVARTRLERQEALQAQYATLLSGREAVGYPERLFAFYAELDPIGDQGLIAMLRPDFLAHSRTALEEATRHLTQAELGWRAYQRAGGIQTELRLEPAVSSEFERLAGLLRESFEGLNRGLRIQQQLAVRPTASWSALRRAITQELSVQRSALRNLEVLAPTVREGKLALLPEA